MASFLATAKWQHAGELEQLLGADSNIILFSLIILLFAIIFWKLI